MPQKINQYVKELEGFQDRALSMQHALKINPDTYCGVQVNTSSGATYQYPIMIMYGTFKGFHRVFTEDEKFDKKDPQNFKDDYVGRIVISIGKIATDTKLSEEWEIKYDKEGITIEDALPMIELSRIRGLYLIHAIF
jgi:hypothetical protein